MVRRQREFRRAADAVTDAFMAFEEIEAVAVIGSVARPLWKEVPRFRAFRRARVAVWHECGDLDLAVWISSLDRLATLRRERDRALSEARDGGSGPVGNQVDVFLLEPRTDRYLGRLCEFGTCPRGKRECAVPGCGIIPFNRVIGGFVPAADLLAPAAYAMLYRRGQGRLMSALDLPQPGADDTDSGRAIARKADSALDT